MDFTGQVGWISLIVSGILEEKRRIFGGKMKDLILTVKDNKKFESRIFCLS
jgi:hypothetical protein